MLDFDYHYAGFWKRLGAGLVDTSVLLPLMLLYHWGYAHSRTTALVLVIPSTILFSLYGLYFHARWGQTVGKMLMKVQVLRVEGIPIGWKEALLRHSVDMPLSILQTIGQFVALLAISDAGFSDGAAYGPFSREFLKLQETINDLDPMPFWLPTVLNVWIWSEMIFLLLNKKKRALHDLIASTIVVCVKRDESGHVVPERIAVDPL